MSYDTLEAANEEVENLHKQVALLEDLLEFKKGYVEEIEKRFLAMVRDRPGLGKHAAEEMITRALAAKKP